MKLREGSTKEIVTSSRDEVIRFLSDNGVEFDDTISTELVFKYGTSSVNMSFVYGREISVHNYCSSSVIEPDQEEEILIRIKSDSLEVGRLNYETVTIYRK